jgi:hypothetical protein
MKNSGSIFSQKPYNNSTTESKDNELTDMSEKEFRNLLLKMINDLKKDSNEQINKVRRSTKT